MNDIDVNRVLAQIRSLGAQAAQTRSNPVADGAASKVSGGFQDFLSNSINRVNTAQSQSNELKRAFELGDPTADLSNVMLAQAKAQVSFKAMVEVRNRLVSAYQEIMNMPV